MGFIVDPYVTTRDNSGGCVDYCSQFMRVFPEFYPAKASNAKLLSIISVEDRDPLSTSFKVN